MFVPFLWKINAFPSTNIQMHSLSYPVKLSFVFFFKKFRTLRNNVKDCFNVGFTIQHLGSFLELSIFVLMFLVLIHWSWALVISDSVALCKWPFCNQFYDFMPAILSVSLMNWPWSLLFFASCFLLVCRLCLVIFGGSVSSCFTDNLHAAEISLSWVLWT